MDTEFIYEYQDYVKPGMKFAAYRETVMANQEQNPHRHNYLELVYIISGNAIHTVDGVAYPMTKGDLLLIDTNQSHSFVTQTQTTHANMILLPDFLSENLHSTQTAMEVFAYYLYNNETEGQSNAQSPRFRFTGSSLIAVDHIVSAICDEIAGEGSHFREIVSSYLNVLFYHIIRSIESGTSAPLMHDIRDLIPGILDDIEKNCAEPISLNDMAKRYYYSPSYFSRAFKRHFGTTFSVYVQNVRIQKVIAMLEQTDLSVDQISEKLGYSDKRELYRAFKHVTGTTPSRYRRAKQGG